MKGIIVYDRSVAADREWYIGKYIEEFARYGVECRLVYTDETDNLEDVSFAVMRDINYKLSLTLEKTGIRVFNSSVVSGICNDKLSTYRYIEKKELASFLPVSEVSKCSRDWDYPCVLKSRDGHGGTEVFWIDNRDALTNIMEDKDPKRFILQKACNTPGIDVRVYVIGGEIIAAMKRMGSSEGDISLRFRSNYCLGGSCERYDIWSDDAMLKMVKKITSDIKMDFAGIDFIFHDGKPMFNEIEDVVGARMLYDHTDIDIVARYVDYIVREMQ